jgi:thiol-disulfide isomerase/thioredoxin
MTAFPKINLDFKMSKALKNALFVFLAVVVIVGLVALLKKTQNNTHQDPFLMYNNFENFSNDEWEEFAQDDKKIKVVLVYANWCPYCEEYLSDKATGSDKNVFDTAADKAKNVVFEKLDAAESKTNQEIANSYGVQGYPTIIAAKFDATKSKYVKIATFEGNRNSVDELVAFAGNHST